MRKAAFAFVILCLAACSPAGPASGPSKAMLDMQAEFERQVLAIEPQIGDDAEGLRKAAIGIALKVYGKDWSVVKAETQRSLASLQEIDLKPFESAEPEPSAASASDVGAAMREMAPFMTPGGMAAMRFWDARFVGGFIGPVFVRLGANNETPMMIGTKLALVPGQTFRGKFKGEDVLASRYMRSLVIAPYILTGEGMIMPLLDKASVYAYRP